MGIIIIFTIVIAIIFVIVIANAIFDVNDGKEFREQLRKKFGEPTRTIGGICKNDAVYVYEGLQIIIIKGIEYRFDYIIDFSVNEEKSYKVSTSTGSAVGRAIAGGFLFGGVGALSGAGTASKTVKTEDNEIRIYITTKELSNPIIEYKTIDEKSAYELISVLKIILNQINSKN